MMEIVEREDDESCVAACPRCGVVSRANAREKRGRIGVLARSTPTGALRKNITQHATKFHPGMSTKERSDLADEAVATAVFYPREISFSRQTL